MVQADWQAPVGGSNAPDNNGQQRRDSYFIRNSFRGENTFTDCSGDSQTGS